MRLAACLLPIALAAAAPQTCPSTAVVNGDFGHGLDSWYSPPDGSNATIVSPGSSANNGSSHFSVQSQTLNVNSRFSLYQNLQFCPQVEYNCTLDYRFDAYYEVSQSDGSIAEPLVAVYVDAYPGTGVATIRLPSDKGGVWLRQAFTFLGYNSPQPFTLEISASSPQAASAGDNHVRFDNIQCSHN